MIEENNNNSSTRALRPFSERDKGEKKRRDDFPMLTLEIKADELAAVIARLQAAGEIANAGALECLALIDDIRTAAAGCTELFAILGAQEARHA